MRPTWLSGGGSGSTAPPETSTDLLHPLPCSPYLQLPPAHAPLPSPTAGATGGSGSATPVSPFGAQAPGGQAGGAPGRGGQPSGPRVSDGSGMGGVSASPASRPGSVSGYGAPVPSPSGAGVRPHGPGGGGSIGGGLPAADGGGGVAGGGGTGMQGMYPLPGGPSGLHDSVKIVVTAPPCGDRGEAACGSRVWARAARTSEAPDHYSRLTAQASCLFLSRGLTLWVGRPLFLSEPLALRCLPACCCPRRFPGLPYLDSKLFDMRRHFHR